MKRGRRKKSFDCIAFKRQAQAQIYKEIKGLSPKEEIAYFRRQAATGPLGNFWKALERPAKVEAGSEASPTTTGQHQLISK